ncbi:RagB/SusD family nutrient uptake outer membrane protein [Puia sp. P3]|uniref:RagB/SusD family nutrient uptake outer membrane protein n=1 Tax=Puia sp. P3 TaxID=3423952 RepID=UPI003D6678AE
MPERPLRGAAREYSRNRSRDRQHSQPQPDGAAVRLATAEGALFQPKRDSTAPVYAIQDSLFRSFEPGDTRVAAWTKRLVLRGKTYIYPWKYRQTVWTNANPEYETVMRMAEMYLIRAEARARVGDAAGAAADLNLVRQRAGLGPVDPNIGIIDAVMHERRVEFFSEWGHRWMDLKRTGMADGVLGGKAGWKATDALYPIPASELLANPNLTQNNGY